MQNKYYYLVASLPNLKFSAEVPISVRGFLSECEKWLSQSDLQALSSANIRCTPRGCERTQLLTEWKEFEQGIRDALALAREARKKGEEYRGLDRMKNIMAQENPLLMEKALEKERWDFLDGMVHEYFFDLSWLIVYYLKLHIIERLATFNKDEGERYFYELCEVDYEKAIR